MKSKIFKDPVHGYIKIPAVIVDTFIDTELFQRLRRIEQTSMRCLYPSARHDRFIHSLGVYHLGRRAIDALFENTSDEILHNVFKEPIAGEQLHMGAIYDVRETYKEEIEVIKTSFMVACLMHDCAHSPFSHTLEKFYYNKDDAKTYIKKIDDQIKTDLKSQSIYANPHEVVSSYVLVRWLEDVNANCDCNKKDAEISYIIDNKKVVLKLDLEFIVRCIMGRYYYKESGDHKKSFYNAVINLLNSQSIDVDKLDYIVRDTYNSGVDNFSIDIDRFISSIIVLREPYKTDSYVLGYKKNSLSILKSIIYARDHLFTWIYSHHKVVYHAEMIKKMLKSIDAKCTGLINSAFDFENFFVESKFEINGDEVNFYMVNDGDLSYVFKLYSDSSEYKSIFARQHHVSMWKSYAEYYNIFKFTPFKLEEQKDIVKMQYKKIITNYKYNKDDFFIVDSSYKEGYIHPNKTYIEISGETRTIWDMSNDFNFPRFKKEFFYLYLPRNITKEHKNELMEKILRNI